jgi:RHS repeat-associated protein
MAFTTTNLTLNASTEWLNTGITISSGQELIVAATGFVKPWGHWPNPGIPPNGDPTWPTPPGSGVYIPNAPFCMLIGRLNASVPFPIGAYRNLSNLGAQGYSGTLYLAINDVAGGFGDNSGSFSVTLRVGVLDPTDHEKLCDKEPAGCFGYSSDCPTRNAPVSLYDAEKREEVTDLSVITPVDTLQFIRSYRQSKLGDADYQFMGLGWTHNHFGKLVLSGTSPNRTADVLLPGGGLLRLLEDSGSAGHFDATNGSTATLDYDSSPDEYILTAQDKSQLIFDGTSLALIRFDWPSGDSWTYNYSGSQLTEVVDSTYDIDPGGPTVYRCLQFTYIDNPSQFDDGQLWRVGDHTAGGLDSGSPTGRYVEFGYVPERDDGVVVGSPKALLATVRDVRGYTWTYDWYGQDSGEDDADQLNFLAGVGAPGGTLQRKRLSYELTGSDITAITQELGIQDTNPALQELRYEFEADVTKEIIAGKETQYHFLGGAHTGVSDPAGNRRSEWPGLHYRPDSRVDANGNETALLWSADGKYLEQMTDALGHPTAFEYNIGGASADTLDHSLDAEGRKTEYTYGDANNPRLPTVIKVIDVDGSTVLRWQAFSYDMGRILTEQLIDPLDGTTVLQEIERIYDDSGNGNGLLHQVIQKDIGGANDVTTTYTYDSIGRVIKTQQSSSFGSCDISFTVYDEAGNVVASICNYDPGMNPDPTDAAEAVALYDEMEPDKNRVTTHEYDALGRRVQTTVNAGASFAQTTVTLYDALDRVVRTIASYVPQGASDPADWIWNTANGRWEDGSSNPIDHGERLDHNLIADTRYNERGFVRWQRDALGRVTLFGYDDAGRLIKTIQNAATPGHNNTYLVTDPATDPTLDDDMDNTPDPTLANYPWPQPGQISVQPDEDLVTEQVYDANGNSVENLDVLGQVALTVYDALNRPVLTVRNYVPQGTSDPADWEWSAANARWEDGSGNAIDHGSDLDENLLSATTYDLLGRVVSTRDGLGSETLNVYDALGRLTHQIVNYVVQGSSDPANWEWSAGNGRWEDGSSNPIDHGAENDQNLITLTEYDAEGRTTRTIDVLGHETHYAYDGLGRQTETIVNYVDGSYNPAVSDEDLTSATHYDDDGRVFKTVDPRGNVTLYGYDTLGRQVRVIQNASNTTYDVASDPDLDGYTPAMGAEADQDRITVTMYDVQGRVLETLDPAGILTRFGYDALGRGIRTVVNYTAATDPVDWVWNTQNRRWEDSSGNAIDHGSDQDENLVSETAYDLAGQVIATRDARGTQTTFVYDAAGRRRTVTQAAGTPLAMSGYTCYDKAGRVLRVIQNWISGPGDPSPDEQDGSGDWLFAPSAHGVVHDENLITEYTYDQAGRQIKVIDPVGNETTTTYFVDGPVDAQTDPEGMITVLRYDQARRQVLVVQNHIDNGEDPALWVWDAADTRWEESDGTAIVHGAEDDENIIVRVARDLAGRITSLRDPRGNETIYEYDKLGRRTTLTNPLSMVWETAYEDLTGGTRTTQTYPGVNGGGSYSVQRDFDRLGRPASIQYGDPANTPDVDFGYDAAGNRTRMTEYSGAGFTNPVRETLYSYDTVRRLTSVGFDTDADSSVDETVTYEYDTGGLRTTLTLPGGTDSITYVYDTKGQLVKMTDWDGHVADFHYDDVGRHIATIRSNRLATDYRYDPAGRLRRLRHLIGTKVRTQFLYEVNGRGSRTQAYEYLAQPSTVVSTHDKDDGAVSYSQGTWSDHGDFKESSDTYARMAVEFTGNEAVLTFGVGPDHSLFDVYINATLWESFDGYAASAGERSVNIQLVDGTHRLEMRNRVEKNPASSGYKIQFRQLQVLATTYTDRTIDYTYDALARLIEADYNSGTAVFTYGYDLAGNLTNLDGTSRTYNAANQMTNDGTNSLTYDNNGNLTGDGVNSYTWDRTNRLLEVDTGAPAELTAYAYDGVGNRISQAIGTSSPVVTQYLLDTQPGLVKVLRESDGMNTHHYIHGLRGVHARYDGSAWNYYIQDALGSIRGIVDANNAVLSNINYSEYGVPDTTIVGPAFTGEWRDEIEIQYHRARYMSPGLGTWLSLDPFEGTAGRPMSLNGYSYVEGDVVNAVDPTGARPACQVIPPTPTQTDEQIYNTITNEAKRRFSRGARLNCLMQVVQNEVGTVGSGIDEQAEWLTWAILNRYSATRELDYRNSPRDGGSCGNNLGNNVGGIIGGYKVCEADDGISFNCIGSGQIDPVISNAVVNVLLSYQYRSLSADPTHGGAGWRQNPNSPVAGETWPQRYAQPCGEFYCRERQQHFPNEAVVAPCGGVNYVETVEEFYDRVETRQRGYNNAYSTTRRSTGFNMTRSEARAFLGGCVDRLYVTTVNPCEAWSDGDNICWITQSRKTLP